MNQFLPNSSSITDLQISIIIVPFDLELAPRHTTKRPTEPNAGLEGRCAWIASPLRQPVPQFQTVPEFEIGLSISSNISITREHT